ncbi:MAG TPA: glycosyltransferase family 2 protein [Anaerohalosphaeraceae bacterium]|nr:glycosyltransferase family 2 protein [Anaerohalosphaeraceae bacterium]HOL88534.1 glycosyltransferase family 2 protein [Anaerohalosphaeraceae bacterium]HPP56412.1 glycosyltransferase family 2 protein [Anaerohalosphaeraceae bacterium]
MVERNASPQPNQPSEQTGARSVPAPAGGISVIIPAYNSEAFIRRAIDSVLAQTLPPQEIIIVDDGSTDGTRQAVQSCGGNIRYIRQDNQGASAARNAGILAASGEWIAFLDADDEWLPDRLALQVRLLQQYPFLNWVTGNFYRCRCRRGHQRTLDLPLPRQDALLRLLNGQPVFDSYFSAHQHSAMGCTDTMLIRREILLKAGLFRVGQKRINDVDLWLRIAYLRQPLGYVFEPLAVYHLDTEGSILKAHRQPDHIDQFLRRHFELAQQAGMLEPFRPCAAAMLGWWLGQRLREGDGKQVRFLLNKYRSLFSASSFRKLYISSFCPRTATLYNHIKEYWRKRKENPAE